MLSFTGNQFGDTFINWDKVPEDVKTQVEEDMASYLKQGQAMHEAGQVQALKTWDQNDEELLDNLKI